MNERPMRFHWFWSHISMFLGIFTGISKIGQAFYERASIPPDFQWTYMVDLSVGIIYFFVCLCAFINRNKRTLVAWYLMLSPPLINIGYLFISILAYYNWKIDTTSLWAQVSGGSIYWVLLLIYYSKRKAMFDGRIDYTSSAYSSPEYQTPVTDFDYAPIKPSSEPIPESPPAPEPVAEPEPKPDPEPEPEPSPAFVEVSPALDAPVNKDMRSSAFVDDVQKIDSSKGKGKKAKGSFRKKLPLIAVSALCLVFACVTVFLYADRKSILRDSEAKIEKLNDSIEDYRDVVTDLRHELQDYTNAGIWFSRNVGFVLPFYDNEYYHNYDCAYTQIAIISGHYEIYSVDVCGDHGYRRHSCWDQ